MIELSEKFHGVVVMDGDAWVADYTESTQKLDKADRKGVVIADVPFDDIAAFHLVNHDRIPYYAINFEKNKSFFPKNRKDCECMFRCKDVIEGGWLLLCELKYGKDKEPNNSDNAQKAYHQLMDTWNLLKEKNVINPKQCRAFLNISMPTHLCPPFESFAVTQMEIIRLKKKFNVVIMGVNEMLIVNKGILKSVI